MTDVEIVEFVGGQLASYVDERVTSGESADEAQEIAAGQMRELFPGGRPAQGQLLYRVVDDGGTAIGVLWIGPHRPGRHTTFWVWDIEIDEAQRGKGLGRAAMQLAEEAARAQGATELGLNVFGHNAVARQLYESMGYQTVAVNMLKSL